MFCASAPSTPIEHVKLAEQFGKDLAVGGFDLVWGGCEAASMGALARGVQSGGGKVFGVILERMLEEGLVYRSSDILYAEETLSARKQLMGEMADAFVVLPGGFGTLDEFASRLAESIIDAKHGIQHKKIAVLNWERFYSDLVCFLEGLYAYRFADISYRDLYRILPDTQSVLEYLKE